MCTTTHGSPAITLSASPGPVETELVAAARAHGRLWLIADGARPERDPKRWAAACDGSDAEACTRAGALLTHQLFEPARGLALLRSACERGSAGGCYRAARVLANPLVPAPEPASAVALFEKACEASAAFPGACSRAVGPELVRAAGPKEQRPDRTFALLDRGCSLGDRTSCERLARDLKDAEQGLGEDAELAADYAAFAPAVRLRQGKPPPPEIVERRDRLAKSLAAQVARRRAQHALGGLLQRLREQCLRTWWDGLVAEVEACAEREPIEVCRRRVDQRAFPAYSGCSERSVAIEPAAHGCIVACPAAGAGEAASVACICRCLDQPGASDAPPELVRACIDDVATGRWNPGSLRRGGPWYLREGY